MRIGILGAGYADGIFHRLSNRGQGHRRRPAHPHPGHRLDGPDHHRPEPHRRRSGAGDEVTLLGSEGEARLDAQQIARVAGTISYNILCSISARVRRVYV